MKLVLLGAEKVGGLYDIKNAIVMKYEGTKRAGLVERGFRHVTPSGYKSQKRVLAELEVVGEHIEAVYNTDEGRYIDVSCPVISEKQLESLRSEYLQPVSKVWLGTAAQQARSRNAAGWAGVCRDHMWDPYDRG